MSEVKFEDILSLVGHYGKWQITVFLWIAIFGGLAGMCNFSSAFLAGIPKHWCQVADVMNNNWTTDQIKQFSIPKEEDGDLVHYSQCRMYDRNYSMYTGSLWSDVQDDYYASNLSTRACQQWYYDLNEYGPTVVTKWDLICEYLPLQTSIQATYMGGVFTGALLSGIVSDRFGRKFTMNICIVAALVTNIISAFSVTYGMFIAIRYVMACSISGGFTTGFVIVMEILGPEKRTGLGIFYQGPFAVGVMLLPGIAYLIRNWFWLQIAISFISMLCLLYYWVLPESPRWLMTKGRFQEAEKILQQAARKNGYKELDSEELKHLLESFKKNEVANHTDVAPNRRLSHRIASMFSEVIVLFRTTQIRKRTLISFYCWMVVSLVYYGISFNAKNVDMSPYIMISVSGAVEIPAFCIVIPLLTRFGRKKCCVATYAVGGAACLLILAVPRDLVWLAGTLSIIGKMCLSAAFSIVYVYTAELFPTVVRNVAVGGASMSARIGSMIAPFIVDLLAAYHRSVPSTIFGACSLSAGLLILLLPETLHRKLPETVEEVESTQFRNNEKSEKQEAAVKLGEVEDNSVELNSIQNAP